MASMLLNAEKARQIRRDFEQKVAAKDPKALLDFSEAIEGLMDVKAFDQSTLMIIQTPVRSLKSIPGQNLRVKVSALNLELDTVETDDYLNKDWLELPLATQAQTLVQLPEAIQLSPLSSKQVEFTKGEGHASIIVYYPFNHGVMTSAGDRQSQVLDINYVEE